MLQFLHQWICLESLVEEFHNTLLATAIIGLSVSEPHLVELLDEIYYTIAYTYRMLVCCAVNQLQLGLCMRPHLSNVEEKEAAKSVDE